MRKVFFVLFSLLNLVEVWAQTEMYASYQLSFRYHYGFVIAHTPSLQQFSSAHFPVYEITLSKLTNGSKTWQRDYHLPDLNLSFLTTNFGNNKTLGNSYALLPSISFPYLRKNWIHANFRFGAGLAYLTSPFDRLSNYKNNAIGSKINSAISVQLETKHQLTHSTRLYVGLALNHFSNGATKIPNLGVNLATANLALAYSFARKPILPFDSLAEFKKHNEFFVLLCGGFKEIAPAGGNKYGIACASFNFSRVHSRRGKWGSGIDVFYDDAIKEQFKRDQIPVSTIDVAQIGLNVCWEVIFGNVSFPLQAGVYLHSKYKSNGTVYNRYGIRYHFYKRMIANVSLKTHYAKADYFEWGLGYTF